MRDFILVFVAALIASVLTYVIAEHAAPTQAHTAAVITDQRADTVRIVIGGNEVARFDKDGLTVDGRIRGDIDLPLVAGDPPLYLPAGGARP